PTLICCKTKIGFGSPNKEDTEACHGAPLGSEEIAATRRALGWEHGAFEVPDDIYAAWDAREHGNLEESKWDGQYQLYAQCFPELASELNRRLAGKLPNGWERQVEKWTGDVDGLAESAATRKASQSALSLIGQKLPELVGGSADLTGSNLTCWNGANPLIDNFAEGRHINYGVREFAMSAINNGIMLHGGFVAFCGTFLMFSEYARNALRMAALMKLPSIYVYTHDSIGLGEDGPTHQPVEQTASLRLIPNMDVWRPCDSVETMVAWSCAVENQNGPTCLLFSRQTLAHQVRSHDKLENIRRGGYILRDCLGTPAVILIATGSEVSLAMQAAEMLSESGCDTRVVSMPCAERFEQQEESYREQVLPTEVRARVAVEAGVTDWWKKYTGLDGAVIGIDRFGESAPAQELFQHFGLTAEAIVEAAQTVAGMTVTEAA
ncbi:MAG: transketolase family protein, partial [bacterium]